MEPNVVAVRTSPVIRALAVVLALAAAACGLLERTLFISFDHPTIAQLVGLDPSARTALLTEGPALVDPLSPAG